MDEQYYIQRVKDYKQDIADDEKALLEAEKELEQAIQWKYKMMDNLVKSYQKLQDLLKENG